MEMDLTMQNTCNFCTPPMSGGSCCNYPGYYNPELQYLPPGMQYAPMGMYRDGGQMPDTGLQWNTAGSGGQATVQSMMHKSFPDEMYEIQMILREFRNRVEQKERSSRINKEWRCAAILLDRFFLILYMVILVVVALCLLTNRAQESKEYFIDQVRKYYTVTYTVTNQTVRDSRMVNEDVTKPIPNLDNLSKIIEPG
ncbi:hypothetical protein Ciccas_001241 [Cichlidogyrus casuarinus]|uniref:Uncharacterized protein n=1 Tax=Cichlidogyrus casuarinus TaxID=1844966 RepID=A0ABD2QL46_9PLAT